MFTKTFLISFIGVLLAASVSGEGLYSKGSAVLQIDGTSYQKLVVKSNQVSIVEFYAPWCGHCKSLKPEYEKAAKGLKDLAQVVAVNCDEELNKPFCGSMGVQGFPTLKIVKPSKKPGKPIVEDYQGARTASGIIDAVKSAIPNNVKKVTDKGLSNFLENTDGIKAMLFTEKGTTSALMKVLALEYLSSITFAQIRDKESAAVKQFGVTEYPTLIVLPGGDEEPVKFEGSYKKTSIKDFLGQYALPSSQTSNKKQKPMGKKSGIPPKEDVADPEEAASSFSSSSASASPSYPSAEASGEAAGAPSITLEDESNPTESPDPIVSADAPKPVVLPEQPNPIPVLLEQKHLEERCLGAKTSTCILALLPNIGDEEVLPDTVIAALSSLGEIADKHVKRESKLFPFYSIPFRNTGSAALRNALDLGGEADVELVAVNARRGWWRRYEAEKYDFHSVENWVDNIRFGEGPREKLPESLFGKEVEEEEEQPAAPAHVEL